MDNWITFGLWFWAITSGVLSVGLMLRIFGCEPDPSGPFENPDQRHEFIDAVDECPDCRRPWMECRCQRGEYEVGGPRSTDTRIRRPRRDRSLPIDGDQEIIVRFDGENRIFHDRSRFID
jgi:hypothetical protein